MNQHPGVYLVQVRRGSDVDQYWIGGPWPDAAMREAARLAGVKPDQVVSATLQESAAKPEARQIFNLK